MAIEIKPMLDEQKRRSPPDVSKQILARDHIVYCLNCKRRMVYTGVWNCPDCGAKVSVEKREFNEPARRGSQAS
ncbi:MAG TPA: hypothetical protein VMU35_06915 [Methylomirabilota bacterium]|nr:hypothetical protein [Methylomirabilota bacterium]